MKNYKALSRYCFMLSSLQRRRSVARGERDALPGRCGHAQALALLLRPLLRPQELWDELYKNRSSRKADSQQEKMSSRSPFLLIIVSENRFSGKTYFLQLAPQSTRATSSSRTWGRWWQRSSRSSRRISPTRRSENQRRTFGICRVLLSNSGPVSRL